jgi:DNA-binding Lrp family transcriptional regulator
MFIHLPQRGMKMDIDETNIKIINALVNNPNTKSKELARAHGIPLSTIQRRRTLLERTILMKKYSINVRELGWRTADLFVSVEKDNSVKIAEALLANQNVIASSIRVGDPKVNVAAQVYYKSTEELHNLVESTKAMPHVMDVEWSEVVRVLEKEQDAMFSKIFG